jgi:SRSO17 transposase
LPAVSDRRPSALSPGDRAREGTTLSLRKPQVRPANQAVERPIKAAASAEHGWWDGILPDCWLLVEWPADTKTPIDYWLSNLPSHAPISGLVRLAKVRWRIDHDYRKLKHGLSPDHFEGRSGPAGTTTTSRS